MRRQHLRGAAWFFCLALIAGCGANVGVSMRTFGAATVEDLRAEENYKAVYATQVAQLHLNLQPFYPSGSDPGVCNRGGSASACIAADT